VILEGQGFRLQKAKAPKGGGVLRKHDEWRPGGKRGGGGLICSGSQGKEIIEFRKMQKEGPWSDEGGEQGSKVGGRIMQAV